MSLFFEADWFDARLAEKGLDRGALAAAAGIERGELHRLFANERPPTAQELAAFASLLGADLVEVTLRSGVAARESAPDAQTSDRIESIEARLDAIDDWLDQFEAAAKKKAAGE